MGQCMKISNSFEIGIEATYMFNCLPKHEHLLTHTFLVLPLRIECLLLKGDL